MRDLGHVMVGRDDSAAWEAYASTIHQRWGFYATWPPDRHISVGAIGVLDGSLFRPVSTLAQRRINAPAESDPSTNRVYDFTSDDAKEKSIALSGSVQAGVANAAAGIQLSFAKAHSVYLYLKDCIGETIQDSLELGHSLLDKFRADDWPLNLVVATRVVSADSATLIQAVGENADITVRGAGGGSCLLDLIKAGGSINIVSKNSIGLKFVGQGGLTPLAEVSGLKHRKRDWFFGGEPWFAPGYGHALIDLSKVRKLRGRTASIESVLAPQTGDFPPLSSRGEWVDLSRFKEHVRSTPNIDLDPVMTRENQLLLDVKVPRYGRYYDFGNVIHLSSRLIGSPHLVSGGVALGSIPFGRVPLVHQGRASPVLDKARIRGIRERFNRPDFLDVKVALGRSGSRVQVRDLHQLATLATTVVRQQSRDELSKDLVFGVIR
jgi:hypothetical protein